MSLLGLSGCGSIIISSGPGPTTTVVPEPTVHIGLLAPLGGPQVATGQAIKDGAELAVSQYDANTSSKVHATLDIESATATPARAARALVAKGVVGVVGPATDTEAAAADPVFERAGIPQVVVSATADDLSDPADLDFHRVVASDAEAGEAEAQWLVDQGVGTVQVVDDGLSDNSTLVAQLSQTLSSDLGSQPPPYTYPSRGRSALDAAVDLTSEEPEPDAIVFVGSAARGGALALALRDLAFGGTVLLAGAAGDPASAATEKWVSGATDGSVNLACVCDDPASATGQALTFVTAYTGAYGVAPPEWAAQAYDATNAILASLSATASGDGTASTTTTAGRAPTATDVEAALEHYSANGVSGPIAFDPTTGELSSPRVWISGIHGGRVVQQSSVTATTTAASD